VILQIDRFGIAALQSVERRLSNVQKTLFDQRPHLPEKESKKQGADMGGSHVRVGHDDDAVIARLLGLEILAADAGAERLDQGADPGGSRLLVDAGALDIEDLPLQRLDHLEDTVAALLGRAAGAVALDDEEFAL